MLKQKQKKGEELTDEELEVVNEKRERVRKKDQEEVAAKGGKGKAPPAKGKAAPPKGGAPAQDEEAHDVSKIEFPKSENHYNDEIYQFLSHFDKPRKIERE